MADRANEQRRSSSKGYGGFKTTRERSIADEAEKAKAEVRARAKRVDILPKPAAVRPVRPHSGRLGWIDPIEDL